MGKYEPLGAFLNDQTRDQIPMTFAEIEKILGATLPASKQYPAWWSNNTGNNVMTRQWLDAGYQTESVDTVAQTIVFHKIEPNRNVEYSANLDKSTALPKSPVFGCMAGTVTIPDGVDLTEPSLPDWERYADEKYGPK